jgi:16S rRNA (guanine527-N7)-methyltransferase
VWRLQAEVEAARKAVGALGGQLRGLHTVDSSCAEGQPFTAVVVAKVAPTPAKYPRSPGTPGKNPL